MTDRGRGRALLEQGLEALGIDATAEVVNQLLEYQGLVKKWSRAYNLVAPGDLSSFVVRHLLDSASVHSRLNGCVLDAGTGAGLPGVPLAILRPDLALHLVDSAGKKVRFLNHVARTLPLSNITPVHARLEELEPAPQGSCPEFDYVISRAFSSLLEFATTVRHLCSRETRLVAMKGRRPDEELGSLPAWLKTEQIEAIEVPYLQAERHLVIMRVCDASGSTEPA